MKINFTTRQSARNFAQQRTAKGLASRVTDNGKETPTGKSRYAVDVSNGQRGKNVQLWRFT